MGWFSKWLGPRDAAAGKAARPPSPSAFPPPSPPAPRPAADRPASLHDGSSPGDAPPGESTGGTPGLLLAWLLEGQPPAARGPSAAEAALLGAIDEVLARGEVTDSLLPRATAFLPQLMALLRQEDTSLATIASRIAQDVPLTAEVLRAASAAAEGGERVDDLQQAVQRIGNFGVQRAAARVVARPMYAGAGSAGAIAAPRLWRLAEELGAGTSTRASAAGENAFDGYLAGLLHGTGWTVALRIADKAGLAMEFPQSLAAAAALEERARRLFGLAARRWPITPAFTALGEACARGLADADGPALARCLRQAQADALGRVAVAAAG